MYFFVIEFLSLLVLEEIVYVFSDTGNDSYFPGTNNRMVVYNSSYAKIYNNTDLRTFGDNPATRRIALLYRSINTRNVRTASKLASARNTRVVTGIVVDIRVG